MHESAHFARPRRRFCETTISASAYGTTVSAVWGRRTNLCLNEASRVVIRSGALEFPLSRKEHGTEQKGFYADRASDRCRHHRHSCRDRDSEVRQHEGEGLPRI